MPRFTRKLSRQLKRQLRQQVRGPRLKYVLLAAGAGLAAERLAYAAVSQGWRWFAGDDPPADPEHPDVGWKEAIGWTAVTGLTVALAGLVARRGAVAGWRRWSGHRLPV
jgi:hypothetical protein